ncbi:hypothetical protein VNO77_15653 [Canavalia gladiata]|uniref:Legume lectin domain-containing protein n=1 Tax=Canavalia gladiata TaxID=3824 RepID=A0AAN9M473_CANGL
MHLISLPPMPLLCLYSVCLLCHNTALNSPLVVRNNSIGLYSSAYNPLPFFEQENYNLSITNASLPTLSQAPVQRPFGFALLEFTNEPQSVTAARLGPKFSMR